jgi:hypothetical protein
VDGTDSGSCHKVDFDVRGVETQGSASNGVNRLQHLTPNLVHFYKPVT